LPLVRTEPGTEALGELLDRIGATHQVPLIAAGGVSTKDDVVTILRRGAVAAKLDTALLLAEEAGTNATHRAALQNPQFATTLVTRAFLGRSARCLENHFTQLLNHLAPPGCPEIHHMTVPIRRAPAAVEDSHAMSLRGA